MTSQHSDEQDGRRGGGGSSAIVSAVLLAAVILGVVLLRPDIVGLQQAAASAVTPTVEQPWPTAAATFTPLPTLTPVATAAPAPTATPIPLPKWESLNTLTVLKYPIQTVAEAQAPPDKLKDQFGTDKVMMLVVGVAEVGLDLSKFEVEVIEHTNRRVRVRLPKPGILEVNAILRDSKIIAAGQRWAFSEYVGLESEALARGEAQLYAQARENDAMIDVAGQLARLRMEEHLHALGFTDVIVTIKQ